MARQVVYECDMPGCSATRTPTNHWFLTEIITNDDFQYSQIKIYPFYELLAEDKSASNSAKSMTILCGEACVHKFISQNLSSLFVHGEAERIEALEEPEHKDEFCSHGVHITKTCDQCDEEIGYTQIYRQECDSDSLEKGRQNELRSRT